MNQDYINGQNKIIYEVLNVVRRYRVAKRKAATAVPAGASTAARA